MNRFFEKAKEVLKEDFPKLSVYEVNEWGSCQYSGALDYFNVIRALEKNLGRDKALEIAGVELEILKNTTIEEAIAGFMELATSGEYSGIFDSEVLEEADISTIENCLEVMRDSSIDLWSAVDFLTGICIPEVKINQNVFETDNQWTGFWCWLLVSEGYVRNPGAFADFDT